MYAEIVAAVQSAKTLAELVKAANSLSNHSQMLTCPPVQEKLTDALTAHLASQEKQAGSPKKCVSLKTNSRR